MGQQPKLNRQDIGRMKLENSVALVTGANRGLGRVFVSELRRRGADRIYATARDDTTIAAGAGVIPLRLDVTDPESIARAAAVASDVDLVINNAGISTHTHLVDSALGDVERELATNFWGPLLVTRAFAPSLSKHGGAVVNVLSLLSWEHRPNYGAYSVSKAASWAMSNVIRQELASSGVTVTAVHVGYMETEMADYVTTPKEDPLLVAAATLDAVAAGHPELVYGSAAARVRSRLSKPLAATYEGLGLPTGLHIVGTTTTPITPEK
jgi:NAD(P)-dependent dehydrogenase (short-subunit alcohol dehydrogenase family)